LKSLIYEGVLSWKNYFHLLTNWMHFWKLDLWRCWNLKELPSSIGQLNAFKNLFCVSVLTWKNYLHLLANWMHSESSVCQSVLT
jgi:hypothetical protein